MAVGSCVTSAGDNIADANLWSYAIQKRSLVFLSGLLLAGCDAWPTVVDNRAPSQIVVQYLHSDYDHWSVSFPVSAGKATSLDRAHWIQNIKGLRIREGVRSYSLSDTALRRHEKACPSSKMARSFSAARDCYLIYFGQGRLQVMATAPQDLRWDKLSNSN